MHIETTFAVPFSPSASPLSLASSDGSYQQDFINMGANANVTLDGIGVLNYQRAIDIARNTEGDLDPTISAYLEGALTDIWGRITLQPETYIMSKDEFAIFNFYRRRFDENEVAEHAVARFWAHTYDAPTAAA